MDRLAAPLLKGLGAQAPRACVESVRAAVTMPFDEGIANERRIFEELVASDESRAQRYAFFVERYVQFRALFGDMLRDEQAAGTIDPDLDVDRIANLFLAAADGLQTQWMLDPSIDMADHVAYLWHLVTRKA